jgi:murein DD-endopeptidase MepM/ murein hydrolase activator NlpD
VRAEPSRLRRPAPRARAARGARRSWLLSHGVAGLAVAALGLGIAGSITSPTHAETPTSPLSGTAVTVGSAPRPGTSPSPSVDPSVTEPFTSAGQQPEPLRKAIVAERAAQRAEELAKAADEVTRAARTESGKARQDQLSEDEKATQAKAAELAKEALDRAIAVRIAAAKARAAAEAAAGQAIPLPDAAAAPVPNPAQPQAPANPAAPAAPVAPATDSGAAASPVPNAIIGAHFGEYGLWSRYHTGLDFRAAYGVPIRAVKSGVVLYAGNSGDWAGNHVAVRHADGMTTMSSHMSRMAVSAGQTVQAGQVIGYVGQTGRAFGAHLHFELYPAGVTYGDVYRAVNPLPWLRAAGVHAG